MAKCYRCQRETDHRTLTDQPLCRNCADWYNEHTGTRTVDQSGLEDFAEETVSERDDPETASEEADP